MAGAGGGQNLHRHAGKLGGPDQPVQHGVVDREPLRRRDHPAPSRQSTPCPHRRTRAKTRRGKAKLTGNIKTASRMPDGTLQTRKPNT